MDKFQKDFFRELDKYPQKEINKFFNLILSSSKKTNYEKFLFKLYDHILSQKTLKNLEKIAKHHYWVLHDYLGEIIDVKYLKNQIKELKKRSPKELEKELKEINLRIRKIKDIEEQLPKNLLEKVKIIQAILYFYNERKKQVLNKVNIYLRKIVQHKFPQKDLSGLRKIYQLSPEEIIKLLKGEEIKDLEERDKEWIYWIKNDKIKKGDKKYLRLVIPSSRVEILKGTPACSGKVKGKVNLILLYRNFNKFRYKGKGTGKPGFPRGGKQRARRRAPETEGFWRT